jgi:hypothetical protein
MTTKVNKGRETVQNLDKPWHTCPECVTANTGGVPLVITADKNMDENPDLILTSS